MRRKTQSWKANHKHVTQGVNTPGEQTQVTPTKEQRQQSQERENTVRKINQKKHDRAKDYKAKAASSVDRAETDSCDHPSPRHLPMPTTHPDTFPPPQNRASRCLPTSADPCHPLTTHFSASPAKCRRLPSTGQDFIVSFGLTLHPRRR